MSEYICKYCGKICKNKNSLAQHEVRCKENPNRIITAFSNIKFQKDPKIIAKVKAHYQKCFCQYCGRSFSRKESKNLHERFCKENPNKEICVGHPLTEENKKRISEGMKKAHAEGRAHNIGECRWNNEPSYPEKWFMEMSKNEGIDQNYIRECPFHKFSLDFAWADMKKVIEIDGEQHHRDTKQKERDVEKDRLLAEEGWKELRIDWSDICNDTKNWIERIKKFINE